MALAPALPGEAFVLETVSGRVQAYAAGEQNARAPLLLVHTVNAAASAAEVRPVYEHGATKGRVYALDLPGYGLSDRSERTYTPRLMTDAVLALAIEVHRRHGTPMDALAASLGCEFLARAAVERPDLFRTISLVSPTAVDGRKREGPEGATRGMPWLYGLLSFKAWDQGLFDTLTRPGVIRYFLERTWGSKAIDEQLWAYCVQTTREPGARFAPLNFLGGNLFSADITTVYRRVKQPVWVSHGVRGDFVRYGGVADFPWKRTVFQTGALPYFEVPAFFDDFERFVA